MKILLPALCAVLAFAAPAFATQPLIDWDPAFYYQPGATPFNAPAGGELKIVGIISAFGPPLDFLDASDPTREYTFYCHSLISNGTTAVVGPPGTIYNTTYTGGVIEIYEDLTPDASFDPNPPNAGVPVSISCIMQPSAYRSTR